MVTQVTASKQEAQLTDNLAAGELVDHCCCGWKGFHEQLRPPAKQITALHLLQAVTHDDRHCTESVSALMLLALAVQRAEGCPSSVPVEC